MKTNYFFLLFFLFILIGCTDDKNIPELPSNTDDMYEGVHDQIRFSQETEDFISGELTFHIKTPDGSLIERKAKHQRFSEVSHFTMEKGLKEGKYQLLSIEYAVKSDCPEIDGLKRQFGLCCHISVTSEGIRLDSKYDSNINLFGAGTPEDPYLIGSPDDLNKIRIGIANRHVSSSTYYSQQGDIDMKGYNDKCGWEGNWYQIGQSSTYPFTGFYYGNGYSIDNMTMKDPNKIAASLFGYVNKAVIMDLTIQKAHITGYCAVSAIAGAIITSGSDRDPTFIKGCKVESSTIQSQAEDGMAVGGIVGTVDPNTMLWIDSCSVKDNTVKGGIAVGGILGGANVLSVTQITNSHNSKGNVEASYMNAGGIVGYADSLYVYLCTNSSHVRGSTLQNKPQTLSGLMGTGGIVGGSGISSIITCRNEGTVEGQRGVGGIIGSTLVKMNPATYNNTFIGYCSNKGQVRGRVNVGGLCGEAQLGTYKSYNEGIINAGSYVGGIVGATPLSSINNTANFAEVSGSSFCGGMAGQMQTGLLALNVNMGNVSVSYEHAGGMVGIAGNCLSMNYCANLADINGRTYIGGLIGEVGDPREWTEAEKRAAIFATIELGVSFSNTIFGIAEAGGTILNCLITTHDAIMLGINGISLTKEVVELFLPEQQKDLTISLSGLITTGMNDLDTDMDKLLQEKTLAFKFNTDLRSNKVVEQYMNEYRKSVTTWYETDNNHEAYRDAMNYKRNLRQNQILDIKRTENIVHTLVDGICFVASTAALIAGGVASGGATVIIAAAGAVVSVVGYINSITALVDDFEENAVVISQCISFGNVNPTVNNDYTGGLIGHLDEGCFISDCLNGSNGKGIGGATVGSPEKQAIVKRCLNIGNQWRYFAYRYNPQSQFEQNYCLENTIENKNIHGADGLNPSLLIFPETFVGWDFQRLWKIPSSQLGYFPVPFQSEMQYENPQL